MNEPEPADLNAQKNRRLLLTFWTLYATSLIWLLYTFSAKLL